MGCNVWRKTDSAEGLCQRDCSADDYGTEQLIDRMAQPERWSEARLAI